MLELVEPRSWDFRRSGGCTRELLVHISSGTNGVNKQVALGCVQFDDDSIIADETFGLG
jgi:hypothetical protein